MLVAIGMLAHFSVTLVQILGKTVKTAQKTTEAMADETATAIAKAEPVSTARQKVQAWRRPEVIMMVIASLYALGSLRPPSNDSSYDLAEIDELPVTSGGRVMLLIHSQKHIEAVAEEADSAGRAIGKVMQWLIDVITRSEAGPAIGYSKFTILNCSSIDLKRRPGFLLLRRTRTSSSRHRKECSGGFKQATDRRARLTKLTKRRLICKNENLRTLVEINRLPETDAGESDFRTLMNMVLVAAQPSRMVGGAFVGSDSR